MAGHHERERILADRSANGARGFRTADLAGDVRVGRALAHRYAEQRLPHAHLEIGSDHDDAQRAVRPPQLRIEDARRERPGDRRVLGVVRLPPGAGLAGEYGLLLAWTPEGEARKSARRR